MAAPRAISVGNFAHHGGMDDVSRRIMHEFSMKEKINRAFSSSFFKIILIFLLC